MKTHIEQQKELMEGIQRQVMEVMRMNEDRYSDVYYESGLQYLFRLENQMKGKGTDAPEMWERIRVSQDFWKWWRIQFNLKNQELVLHGYHSQEQFITAHVYTKVIIPKHVMNLIFPGS